MGFGEAIAGEAAKELAIFFAVFGSIGVCMGIFIGWLIFG